MRKVLSRAVASRLSATRTFRRPVCPVRSIKLNDGLCRQQRWFSWDLNLDDRPSMFKGEADSEPWELECQKAENALDEDNLDEALTFALKAAEMTERGELRPLSLLAEIYTEKGEYDEAIKIYDSVLMIAPKSVPTFVSIANVYARKGDYDSAFQHIDLVIDSDPRNVDALFSRAGFFASQNRRDEAISDLKAITKEPIGNVDKALLVADQLFRLEALDEAADFHQKIIVRDPKRWEGWYGAGICLFGLGFPAEAIDRYNSALLLAPNEPQILVSRALAYTKFKNMDKALEDATQALLLRPNDQTALLLRININFSNKAWAQVIQDAEIVSGTLQQILTGSGDNSSFVQLASQQLSSVLLMQVHSMLRLFIEERNWPKAPEPPLAPPKEYTISEVISEFEATQKIIKKSFSPDLEKAFLILVRARKVDPVSFDVLLPLLWLRDVALLYIKGSK